MILDLMKEKGLKVGKLAAELGVNRSAVYQSINGDGSRKIRVYIAQKVGYSPSFLWGEQPKRKRVLDDLDYMQRDWTKDEN